MGNRKKGLHVKPNSSKNFKGGTGISILMEKNALSTKIICVVMAVLLALLLFPSGAMGVVHNYAVDNGLMPVAWANPSEENLQPEEKATTEEAAAPEVTENAGEVNNEASQNEATPEASTETHEMRYVLMPNGELQSFDTVTQKEEYKQALKDSGADNATTMWDFSEFTTRTSPQYNTPIQYDKLDARVDMFGYINTTSADNCTLVQYYEGDEANTGYISQMSAQNGQNGNYIRITPNSHLKSLILNIGAWRLPESGNPVWPHLYVTDALTKDSGHIIFELDIKDKNIHELTINSETEGVKAGFNGFDANKQYYIFTDDSDQGLTRPNDCQTFGGMHLLKFGVETDQYGSIHGKVDRTETSVEVEAKATWNGGKASHIIQTSIMSATEFIIPDVPINASNVHVTLTPKETYAEYSTDLASFTGSVDLGLLTLNLPSISISGNITLAGQYKKAGTISVMYYYLENGEYVEITKDYIVTSSTHTINYQLDNIPGGTSGIFGVKSSIYKAYAVYVSDIRSSRTHDFTLTSGTNYTITWNAGEITTYAYIHPIDSEQTWTKVLLPSNLKLPEGTELFFQTASQDDILLEVYTEGGQTVENEIRSGEAYYIGVHDTEIKLYNPRFEWEVHKGTTEEDPAGGGTIITSDIASTVVYLTGTKIIWKDGERIEITETALAYPTVLSSPSSTSYGKVQYAAKLAKTDETGTPYFGDKEITTTYLIKTESQETTTINEFNYETNQYEKYTFIALSGTSLPKHGSVYLTQDITISTQLVVDENGLDIDLNGHKITSTVNNAPAILNNGGRTLTIHDSKAGSTAYRHYFNINTTTTAQGRGGVWESTNEVTGNYVDGGIITAATNIRTPSTLITNSGSKNSTLKIYGGAFVGAYNRTNGLDSDGGSGGAVQSRASSRNSSVKLLIMGRNDLRSHSSFGSHYSVNFVGNKKADSTSGYNIGGGAAAVRYSYYRVQGAWFEQNYNDGNNRDAAGGGFSASQCVTDCKIYDIEAYRNENYGKGGFTFLERNSNERSINVLFKDVIMQENVSGRSYSHRCTDETWGGAVALSHDGLTSSSSNVVNLVLSGSIIITDNSNYSASYGGASDNVSLEQKNSITSDQYPNTRIIIATDFDSDNSNVGVNTYEWNSQRDPFTGYIVDLQTNHITDPELRNKIFKCFSEDPVLSSTNYTVAQRVEIGDDSESPAGTVGNLYLVPHTHAITCTPENLLDPTDTWLDTLTAKCEHTDKWVYQDPSTWSKKYPFQYKDKYICKFSQAPLQMQLQSPKDTVYDGKTHPAAVTNLTEMKDQNFIHNVTSNYYEIITTSTGGKELVEIQGEPVNAGTYTLHLNLDYTYAVQQKDGSYTQSWQEGVDFYSPAYKITPRPLSAYILGKTRSYDGTGFMSSSNEGASTAYLGSLMKGDEIDFDSGLVAGDIVYIQTSGNYKSQLISYDEGASHQPEPYYEYATQNSDGTKFAEGKEDGMPFVHEKVKEGEKPIHHEGYALDGADAENYKIVEYDGRVKITPMVHNPVLKDTSIPVGSFTDLNGKTTYNWFDKGAQTSWSPASRNPVTSASDPWLDFHYIDPINDKPTVVDPGTGKVHYPYYDDFTNPDHQKVQHYTTWDVIENYQTETLLHCGYYLNSGYQYPWEQRVRSAATPGDIYFEVDWVGQNVNDDEIEEYESDWLPNYEEGRTPDPRYIKVAIVDNSQPYLELEAHVYDAKTYEKEHPDDSCLDDKEVSDGQQLLYTYTVKNTGGVDAENVAVKCDAAASQGAIFEKEIFILEKLIAGGDSKTVSFNYTVDKSKLPEPKDMIKNTTYASCWKDAVEYTSVHQTLTNEIVQNVPVSLEVSPKVYYNSKAQLAFKDKTLGQIQEQFEITSGTYEATTVNTYSFKAIPKESYVWADDYSRTERSFTWSITPITLEFTPQDASYKYNNEEYKLKDYSYKITVPGDLRDLPGGEKVEEVIFSNNNSRTHAGETKDITVVAAKVMKEETDTSENYVITSNTGKLTVTQITASANIVGHTGKVKYNTFDQTVKGVDVTITPEKPVYDSFFEVERVTSRVGDKDNVDCGIGKVPSSEPYSTELSELGWYYNAPSNRVDGVLPDGDLETNVNIPDTNFVYTNGWIQIVPKPLTDVYSADDPSGGIELIAEVPPLTYNGQLQAPSAENVQIVHYVNVNGTKTIVRTLNSETTKDYKLSFTQQMNVDEYEGTANAEAANLTGYYEKQLEVPWKIDPKAITVKVSDYTGVFDGKSHTLATTAEGLVSDDHKLNVTEWIEDKGKETEKSLTTAPTYTEVCNHTVIVPEDGYTITYRGSDISYNYTVGFTQGTSNITPASITEDAIWESIAGMSMYTGVTQHAFTLEDEVTINHIEAPVEGVCPDFGELLPVNNTGVQAKEGSTFIDTDWETLTFGEDFTFEEHADEQINASQKNAEGKFVPYTFTVTGKNNFTGTRDVSWVIQPAQLLVMGTVITTLEKIGEEAHCYRVDYDEKTSLSNGIVFYTTISGMDDQEKWCTLPEGESLMGWSETRKKDTSSGSIEPGEQTKIPGYYCEPYRCATDPVAVGTVATSTELFRGTTKITNNYDLVANVFSMRITDNTNIRVTLTGDNKPDITYDGLKHTMTVKKDDTLSMDKSERFWDMQLTSAPAGTKIELQKEKTGPDFVESADRTVGAATQGTYVLFSGEEKKIGDVVVQPKFTFETEPVTPTVEGSGADAEYTYDVGDFKIVLKDSTGTITTATKLEISVTPGQQKITPKELTATPDFNDKNERTEVYNGKPVSFSQGKYQGQISYSGVEHQVTNPVWDNNSRTYVHQNNTDSSEVKITAVQVTGKDADHPTVDSDMSQNYTIKSDPGYLKVIERDITKGLNNAEPTGEHATEVYRFSLGDTTTFEYNGTNQGPSDITKWVVQGDLDTHGTKVKLAYDYPGSAYVIGGGYTNIAESKDGTKTQIIAHAPGKYSVVIEGVDNFTGQIVQEWEITQRTIELTPDKIEYFYDGTAKTPVSASVTHGELVLGDSINTNLNFILTHSITGKNEIKEVADAPKSNPAKFIVDRQSVVITDKSREHVTDYYNITTAEGNLVINPVPFDQEHFKLEIVNKDYNGTPQTVQEQDHAVTWTPESGIGTFTLKLGTDYEWLHNTAPSQKDHKTNGDYVDTVVGKERSNFAGSLESAGWNINPINATVTSDSLLGVIYDGKPHAVNTVEFEGLAPGEKIKDGATDIQWGTHSYTNVTPKDGSPSEIRGVNNLYMADGNTTPTTNYNWTLVDGVIEILPRDIGGTEFDAFGPDYEYAGTQYTLTVDTFAHYQKPGDCFIRWDRGDGDYVYLTTRTGSTDFTIEQDISISTYYATDVAEYKEPGVLIKGSGNYTGTRNVPWKIHKAEVVVTATGGEWEFDNNEHVITKDKVTFNGLKNDQLGSVTEWKYDGDKTTDKAFILNVGQITYTSNAYYIETLGGLPVDVKNYKFTPGSATLKVTPTSISDDKKWFPTPARTTYSGAEQDAFNITYTAEGTNNSATVVGTALAGGALLNWNLEHGRDFDATSNEQTNVPAEFDASGYYYNVTINGKGNFTGTKIIKFYFAPAVLNVQAMPNITTEELKTDDNYAYNWNNADKEKAGVVSKGNGYVVWFPQATTTDPLNPPYQTLLDNSQYIEGSKFGTYAPIQPGVPEIGEPSKAPGYYCDATRYIEEFKKGTAVGLVDATGGTHVYDTSSKGKDFTRNYTYVYTLTSRIFDSTLPTINIKGAVTNVTYNGQSHSIKVTNGSIDSAHGWESCTTSDLPAGVLLSVQYKGGEKTASGTRVIGSPYTISDLDRGIINRTEPRVGTTSKFENDDFVVEIKDVAGMYKQITLGVEEPKLNITKRDVTITPDHDGSSKWTWTYDGIERSFDNWKVAGQVSGHYVYQDQTTPVWNNENKAKNVSDSNKKPALVSALIYGKDVASQADDENLTSNYNIDYAKGEFDIKPVQFDQSDFAISAEDYVYNANRHNAGLRVTGHLTSTGPEIYLGESEDYDIDINNSVLEAVDSHKATEYAENGYPLRITGKGNFTGERTGNWRIDPRAVSVEAIPVSVPYDGKNHAVTQSQFLKVEDDLNSGLAINQTAVCTKYTRTELDYDPFNAGERASYTPNVDGIVITDFVASEQVDNANYKFNYVPAYAEITSAELKDFYTFTASDFTYLGYKADTIPTVKHFDQSSPMKQKLELDEDFEWADVTGQYTHSEKDWKDGGFVAQIRGKGNFKGTLTASWKINKANATITPVVEYPTEQSYFIYDGKEKVVDKVKSTGLVFREYFKDGPDGDIKFANNKRTDVTEPAGIVVGITDVVTVRDAFGNATPVSNYNLTINDARLIINPQNIEDAEYVFEGMGPIYTYDATLKTITPNTFVPATEEVYLRGKLKDDEEFTNLTSADFNVIPYASDLTSINSATNANIGKTDSDPSYYYKVLIQGKGNYTGKQYVNWRIEPKDVVIEPVDVIVDYNAQPHKLSRAIFTGLVNGHTGAITNWGAPKNVEGNPITTNSRTKAGKSEFTPVAWTVKSTSGADILLSNYNFDPKEGILQVNPGRLDPDPTKKNWDVTEGFTYYNGATQFAFNTVSPYAGNLDYVHQSVAVTASAQNPLPTGTPLTLDDFSFKDGGKQYAIESGSHNFTIVGKYNEEVGECGNFEGEMELTWNIKKCPVVYMGQQNISRKALDGKDTFSYNIDSTIATSTESYWTTPIGLTQHIDNNLEYLLANLDKGRIMPNNDKFTAEMHTTNLAGDPTIQYAYYCDINRYYSTPEVPLEQKGIVTSDFTKWKLNGGSEGSFNKNYELVGFTTTMRILEGNGEIVVEINGKNLANVYKGSAYSYEAIHNDTLDSMSTLFESARITDNCGNESITIADSQLKYNLANQIAEKTNVTDSGAGTTFDFKEVHAPIVHDGSNIYIDWTDGGKVDSPCFSTDAWDEDVAGWLGCDAIRIKITNPVIQITPKAVTLTPWIGGDSGSNTKEQTYNGDALSFGNTDFKVDGKIDKDTFTISGFDANNTVTEVKDSPKETKITGVASISDSSETTSEVLMANYTYNYDPGYLKINPRILPDPPGPDPDPGVGVFKVYADDFTYNGAEQGDFVVKGKLKSTDSVETELVEGRDFVVVEGSVKKATEANQATEYYKEGYTVTVKGIGNFASEDPEHYISDTWTISPADLDIHANDGTWTFDSLTHTPTGATFGTLNTTSGELENELQNDQKGIVNYFTMDEEDPDTDVYPETYTKAQITHVKENDVHAFPWLGDTVITQDQSIVITTAEGHPVNNLNYTTHSFKGVLHIDAHAFDDGSVTLSAPDRPYNGGTQTLSQEDEDVVVKYRVLGSDGQYHEGLLTSDDYEWADDASQFTHSAKDWKNGGYTARIKSKDGSDFFVEDEHYVTDAWNITQIPATVTPVYQEFTFDGQKHSLTEVTFTHLDSDGTYKDGLIDDENVKYNSETGISDDLTWKNNDRGPDAATYTGISASVKEGNHLYKEDGSETPSTNYAWTINTNSLLINTRDLPYPPDPDPDHKRFVIKMGSDNYIYNGQTQGSFTVVGKLIDGAEAPVVELKPGRDFKVIAFDDGTPSTTSAIEANATFGENHTYKIRVEGMGNYSGKIETEWRIDQRHLDIYAITKSWRFDGAKHTPNGYFAGLQNNQTGTINYFSKGEEETYPTTYEEASVTHVSDGTVHAWPWLGKDGKNSIVIKGTDGKTINNKNYSMESHKGDISVTRQEFDKKYVTFTASDKPYNGGYQDTDPYAHYKILATDGNYYEGDLEFGVDKDYYWADDEGGVYTHNKKDWAEAGYKARVKANEGSDFDLDKYLEDPWNITRLNATVTPVSLTFTYDGQTHKLETVLLGDVVDNENVSYDAGSTDLEWTNNGDKINAGTYSGIFATVKCLHKNGGAGAATPATNYNWDKKEGTLFINPRNLPDPPEPGKDGEFEGTGPEYTYNGETWTVTEEEIDVIGKLIADDIDVTLTPETDYVILPDTGSYKSSATDAGTYTLQIQGKGNYTGVLPVEWKIKQADMDITITGASNTTDVFYNAAQQKLSTFVEPNPMWTADYTGTDEKLRPLFDANKIVPARPFEVDASGTNAGTYQTVVNGTTTELEDYNFDGFTYNDPNFNTPTWHGINGEFTISPKEVDDPDDPTDPGYDPNSGWIELKAGWTVYNGLDQNVWELKDQAEAYDDTHPEGVQKLQAVHVRIDEDGNRVETPMFDAEHGTTSESDDYKILVNDSSKPSQLHAGTYPLVIEGVGNYTSSKGGVNWEILKGEATCYVNGHIAGPVPYDGYKHSVTVDREADFEYPSDIDKAMVKSAGIKLKAGYENEETYTDGPDVRWNADRTQVIPYTKDVLPEWYTVESNEDVEVTFKKGDKPLGILINPKDPGNDPFIVEWASGYTDGFTYDFCEYQIQDEWLKVVDTTITTEAEPDGHVLRPEDFEIVPYNDSSLEGNEQSWPAAKEAKVLTDEKGVKRLAADDGNLYTIIIRGQAGSNYENNQFKDNNGDKLNIGWGLHRRPIDNASSVEGLQNDTYIALENPVLRYTGEQQIQEIDNVTMNSWHGGEWGPTMFTASNEDEPEREFINENTDYTYNRVSEINPGVYYLTISGKDNFKNSLDRPYVIIDEDNPGLGNSHLNFGVRVFDEDYDPTVVTNQGVDGIDAIKMTAYIDDLADLYAVTDPKTGEGGEGWLNINLDIKDAMETIADDVRKEFEKAMNRDGLTLFQYIDVDVNSELYLNTYDAKGLKTEREIHELNQPGDTLDITMKVPTEMQERAVYVQNPNVFKVYREHDGEVTDLEYTYNMEAGTISFTSDKFSNYAFAYDSTTEPPAPTPVVDNPAAQTGDMFTWGLVGIVAVSMLVFGLYLLVRRMNRKNI